MLQHTSMVDENSSKSGSCPAYVSVRQHTSAYVSKKINHILSTMPMPNTDPCLPNS
jgi:hypothetical protein